LKLGLLPSCSFHVEWTYIIQPASLMGIVVESRGLKPKLHGPLHGFVVDLLYKKLYNKSTTNPCSGVWV